MSDLPFLSSPRISSDRFASVLVTAGSPAQSEAATLYAVPLGYALDPAVALAFFRKESSYGTAGVNPTHGLRNWGNLRRAQVGGRGEVVVTAKGPFVRYASWAEGLDDWCRLIRTLYVARGLDTVRKALPVYAPVDDGNNPTAYAETVIGLVERWERESRGADPWAAWGTTFPLPVEQRGYAIPQLWLQNARWLGEAQSEEITRGPAGRRVAWRLFAGGWCVWEEQTRLAQLGRRAP